MFLTWCLAPQEAAVCRCYELSEQGGFWSSGAEANRNSLLWTKRAADCLLSEEREGGSVRLRMWGVVDEQPDLYKSSINKQWKYTHWSLKILNVSTFLHAWTALLLSVWLHSAVSRYRFRSLSNISSFNTDSGSSKSHFPMLPSSYTRQNNN